MTTVLDREMFSEAEAARLLRMPQSTLHYWLAGGEVRGKSYRPVIRPEARADRTVTWAEFVEASLLRQYRHAKVPMKEVRAFVDALRDGFGVPYPLADKRPFASGRQLVANVQEKLGVPAEDCLVAFVSGQLILTPPSDSWFRRVIWDGDNAVGWKASTDPASTVRMQPDVRFGRPAVNGISTEVVWEHSDAGADVTEIASAFSLDVKDVHWALSYENASRAA